MYSIGEMIIECFLKPNNISIEEMAKHLFGTVKGLTAALNDDVEFSTCGVLKLSKYFGISPEFIYKFYMDKHKKELDMIVPLAEKLKTKNIVPEIPPSTTIPEPIPIPISMVKEKNERTRWHFENKVEEFCYSLYGSRIEDIMKGTGLSYSTLRSIMNGNVSPIHMKNINKYCYKNVILHLCRTLDVSFKKLYPNFQLLSFHPGEVYESNVKPNLEKLTDSQKQIINYIFFEEKKREEISKILNIPVLEISEMIRQIGLICNLPLTK